MTLKTVFFLFACSTLVLGFPDNLRAKRQAPEVPAAPGKNDVNAASPPSADKSSEKPSLPDVPSVPEPQSELSNSIPSSSDKAGFGGISDLASAGAGGLGGFGNLASAGAGGLGGFGDLASGAGGFGSGLSGLAGATPSAGGSGGLPNFQNLGEKVKGAFADTIEEEKNSISNSLKSLKELISKDIETKANFMKTAVALGTFGPKLGMNFLKN